MGSTLQKGARENININNNDNISTVLINFAYIVAFSKNLAPVSIIYSIPFTRSSLNFGKGRHMYML